MLVKNWMSRNVTTLQHDQSMQDAIHKVKESGHRILPVMKKDELVGIITDRDLKKASPSDAATLDIRELLYLIARIKVSDIMTQNPYSVLPEHTIEEAAAILQEKKISGLPVVDATGMLLGIITQSDVFRALVSVSGRGREGLQIAVRLEDSPGMIKSVREIIDRCQVRTAAILSSREHAPDGWIDAYFRIQGLDRARLPNLVEEIGKIGTLLYVVDHRHNIRTVYA